MTVAEELEQRRNADGKIVPSEVVTWAAKHKRSALHAALEWDDTIAGERYRVWQVRELIAVYIVEPKGYRQYVSLSVDRRDGGYRNIDDVLSAADLRDIMLQDALDELDRMQRKYSMLKELSAVWEAKEQARTKRGRTAVAEDRAAAN